MKRFAKGLLLPIIVLIYSSCSKNQSDSKPLLKYESRIVKTAFDKKRSLPGDASIEKNVETLRLYYEPVEHNSVQSPRPLCGMLSLFSYLKNHTQWRQGDPPVRGTAFVKFTVSANGCICDTCEIKILKSPGSACEPEAIRVVREMPAWYPATFKGKPIQHPMVLPIKFGLSHPYQ